MDALGVSPENTTDDMDGVRRPIKDLIGHADGDLYDPRCMWLRSRGIARDAA